MILIDSYGWIEYFVGVPLADTYAPYINEVVSELGGWFRTAFMKADSTHKNFYENLASKEDVKDAQEEVNKLVSTLSEKLSGKNA